MKKKSFFERLAGNLRFSDTEEEVHIPEPPKETASLLSRDLPLSSIKEEPEAHPVQYIEEEEVGELPVDMYETQNELIIQTLIAGVLPEHLSISITRDTVTIAGKREANKSIPHTAYQVRELYWGSFERTIELPEEVEIDNSEAIERHGMLMIKMPKLDKRRKSILKIKSI